MKKEKDQYELVDTSEFGKEAQKKKDDDSEQEAPPPRPIKDLFRYADKWDVCLLVLGSLVAIVTGSSWAIMAIIIGDLSDTFIDAQGSLIKDLSNATSLTLPPPGITGNGNQSLAEIVAASTLAPMILTTGKDFALDFSSFDQSSLYLTQQAKDIFLEQSIRSCWRYVYLGIAMLIAAYIQMACWLTACENQIHKLRLAFFRAIVAQDICWYDENQSGTLVTKLSDNLERIREGIGDKFGLLLQYLAQSVAGFIVAFIYSWKLTLVLLSLTPLLAAAGFFMTKMLATATAREQEQYARAGARAEEALSCIRTVIAFNGQEYECERYESELQQGKKDGILKSLYTGIGMGATMFVLFCSYGLAFWYGSTLILNNAIEPGYVFLVFFAVMMGSFALGQAGPQAAVLATARGAAASVLDIIDREPVVDVYTDKGEKIANPNGRIEFDNVTFAYPTRSEVTVLDKLSFTVEPGEKVALVGASGSGKSTIVSLLLRYYDPNTGRITIDGEEVKAMNVHWLRNLIGVVSQEPVLFDGTIEENVRLGSLDVKHADLMAACRSANAHEFVAELPHGYKTLVGERGTQLSGGQKQRIAIARTLVRDPRILLLDEATSALDADSEALVQEALDKAQQGRTTITIAHRLSTVRNADKIIALEQGQIREAGTHVELMNKKGVYHHLVTAQLFQDTGSGYASGDEEGNESDDSGAPADNELTKRQLSRSISRRSEAAEPGSPTRQPFVRLLSKPENDLETLKADLAAEGGQRSNFSGIISQNRQEWALIAIGLLAGIVRGFIMPVFSLFYSEIFNTFSKTGEELRKGGIFWSIAFVCLGIVEASMWIISSYLFGMTGEHITMRMRMMVFRNVMRQDVAYFDDQRHSTGKICTRLATDAPNVKAAVDFRLSNVFSAVVSMVVGIGLGVYFGWKLTLVVCILFPLAALAMLRMKIQEEGTKVQAQLLEEAGKTATEAIENSRTVQALTREAYFFSTFEGHLQRPHRVALRQAQVQAVSFAFAQSVFFFIYAALFRAGAYFVGNDEMTPLNVFRVIFAIMCSGMAVGWATAYFPEYLKARFSAGIIFKMAADEPTIDSASTAGNKPEISGRVQFDNVRFSYPTRVDAPVLRGLEFTVNQGQTMALVGPSGCGKSTVVSLLERFYNPQQGEITIDNMEIRSLNPAHIRQQISLVSQEPILFDFSVAENISYGLKDVSHERVVEAAKLANIHDFVNSLPEGYGTRVGEKGAQLSGGQKQRVAIARALVRNPKILLLDEATSALDSESEKDTGSGYASGDEEGNESDDSGAPADNELTKRQLSRSISRRSEAAEPGSPTRQPFVRLLSKPENDLETLKADLAAEGGQRSNFSGIISQNRQEWALIAIGLLAGIVRGFIMPVFSLFYSEIFNTFSKTGEELRKGGIFWSIAFVCLGIVEASMWIISSYLFGMTGEHITMRMRMMVFRNVMRQDVAYFDDQRHSTGKICTRLATDAPNVKAAVDFRLSNVFSAVVSMVVGIGLGVYFGWKLTLVVCILFPLAALAMLRMKIQEEGTKVQAQLLEEAGKTATEAIENSRTVQALTREAYFFSTFEGHLQRPHRVALRQAQVQAVSFAFAQSVFFFIYAALFRAGAYFVGNDEMTPLNVFRVIFAIMCSGMAVGWATAYFPEYLKARFSAGIIFKMAADEPTIDSASTAGNKPEISGRVQFDNVRFSYPTRVDAPVLRGLEFTVNQGQTMALVGPSGCGKSTVVSLLERFYNPQQGEITIDNMEIRSLNPAHIRQQISLVSQEPILFDFSVAENISYGLKDVSHERVVEAAKLANIHDFVNSLPEGYGTRVGEKGAQLSGGQKQRVAIARALVRNPKILLLDEATSALDSESEKLVQEALDRARSGRTCILIAHRLSTVQNADTIAVVKNGVVIEQGSHGDLVAKRGFYHKLTKKQQLAA